MPLILAIEPDHRQASQLRAMARGRLGADLVHADSAEPALIALAGRVPDLILMPALLSPADEAAIGDYLRVLDAASSHVQTLIIPVLAANRPRSRRRGVLASLKRQQASAPEGCDPKEFAEQCATYLQRATAERERRAEAVADAAVDALTEPVVESPEAPVAEPFAEPMVEALVEFVGEPQAEPAREPLLVEPLRESVVEPLREPVEAVLESAIRSLEVIAVDTPLECAAEPAVSEDHVFEVDTPLECAAEPAVSEDHVFEIEPPAHELEFVELDLSTLVEELSGPNLAIPIEVPVTTAAIDNTVTAPVTPAARETAPAAAQVTHVAPAQTTQVAVAPAVEPLDVVEEQPVAPVRVAVKWAAVYSPPGRWWPSMEGVAVEARPAPGKPSSSRASATSATPKTPASKAAVQDEWGFFDPDRCGFTALLSKLDEITTTEEAPHKQRA